MGGSVISELKFVFIQELMKGERTYGLGIGLEYMECKWWTGISGVSGSVEYVDRTGSFNDR